jgi:signal transduction histidine kinase/ActR/RegA family two-component response regulator
MPRQASHFFSRFPLRLALPNSLRSRLFLLVILAIAPTAIMTLVNGERERVHAIEVAEENLQRLTNLAAANEAQSIAGARQILRDLATVPDLMADDARCGALLAAVLSQNPDYANFGLIQLNGDVTCSAVPSKTPVNLADRNHFRRAIQERRFVAGNYVFGRVIQKHTVNLTYPVMDKNNKVAAVLFAALDLTELDRFVGEILLPPGAILLTADAGGTIISHRPHPEAWFGKKIPPGMQAAMASQPDSAVELEGPDGIKRLHRFALVGKHGLTDYTVTIGLPTADVTAQARRDQILDSIGLLVSIIMALVASWFVAEVLILRRMERLGRTANKIASGSLETRTGIAHGSDEISGLAQSLDAMAEALQRKEAAHLALERQLRLADQRKDEFLAMLAHELRNPLAPISSGAELLLSGLASPPAVERTAGIISRQVKHMTRLVDDLLDVSRVTRGLVTLSLQPLGVEEIVDNALEQVQPLLLSRQHRFDMTLPPQPVVIEGDHKRLVQVLANVLNNAAKYTPAGGHIVLAVSVDKGELRMAVTDNGVGMSAELQSRVFELFAQAERTPDRSQGGLGLGLALVKSLVELHGGRVEASSAGDQRGSTFTITLPGAVVDEAHVLAAPAPLPEVAPGPSLRVLVVDDNVDIVNMLELFLQSNGHIVYSANTAQEAVEAARAVDPQLCLLDIGLPDMSGNALAQQLRALPGTARITMVAVSGYGRKEDREQALAAGFDDYFVKPLDTDRLMTLIARLQARYAP